MGSTSSPAYCEPPTPRNTADMHRKARQAKLILQKGESIDKAELANLIDQLERFGIAADKDRALERETMQKWKENSKLQAPADRCQLGTEKGIVLDGKTLEQMYAKGDELKAAKKTEKAAKTAKKQQGGPSYTHQEKAIPTGCI